MGIIKILDEAVSNIIAAGEVVENPSSLIKELLENSLDADARSVAIEIKDGGRFINISDDGKGMDSDDLLLSVERHATSKISRKEDLFDLTSYGFRGEALSSICAVAKVKIISKTAEDSAGNSMTILGGKVTSINKKEFDKNHGTSIEIRELFFNTPARLKFLRKPITEYSNIKEIIIQEALANPWVGISLSIDGKDAIKTSGNGIQNCIVEIFGRNILKNLIEFQYGFLGNATIFRANRDGIFVFVNGRPVKSKIIENALIDSYYTKLTKGKYPFGIIFVELEPKDVDVNVHPSKKIVKFSNDVYVYDIIKRAIEEKISGKEEITSAKIELGTKSFGEQNHENKIREKIIEKNFAKRETNKFEDKNTNINICDKKFQTSLENKSLEENNLDNKNFQNKNSEDKKFEEKDFGSSREIREKFGEEKINTKEIKEERIKEQEKNHETFESKKNWRVIGQFKNAFILVERDGVLEIYDQHIIQERVLYEKYKKEYLTKSISSQGLLIPQRFIIDPRDKDIIFSKKDILKEFGFEIEELEKNEILIRSIPAFELGDTIESLLHELIKEFKEDRERDPRESVIISMACKAAIKANESLKNDEMEILVKKLHEVGEYTCPHGRPIILKLSLDEIEKKFKRK
ncbi:MAG: DNA mismatch repair endonuclease MutL [Fusobacteriaceae bacterium]